VDGFLEARSIISIFGTGGVHGLYTDEFLEVQRLSHCLVIGNVVDDYTGEVHILIGISYGLVGAGSYDKRNNLIT